MFQIEIHSKQDKTYAFQVSKLDDFLTIMKESQIIWLGDKGFWLPPSEIAQILFQKLPDEGSQPEPMDIPQTVDIAPDEDTERLATPYDILSTYNDSDNPRCNAKLKMSPCGDC